MSERTSNEMYLIIQRWYDGIETLCHLTASSSEAVEKKREFAQKALLEEQELFNELKEEAKGSDMDPAEVSDKFCIQHWNGKEFRCVCQELGVPPKKAR